VGDDEDRDNPAYGFVASGVSILPE
jgi:hypothetical protein